MKTTRLSRRNYQRDYTMMQIPGLSVMAVIFLVPIVSLIYYSTLQYKMSFPNDIYFIGLENYKAAFKNEEFQSSLIVTLQYTAFALAIETPLALALMEVISCFKKGAEFIKTCFLPPMVIPPIVSGLIWRIMFQPGTGVLNYFLSFFGLAPQWLTDPNMALSSVVLVDVWAYTPFLMIILLAGRASISTDLYESAMLDGANRLQCFFRISLPLLRDSLMVGLLFRMTDCIKVFPAIHILTAGGPGIATQTINYYSYRQAFNYGNYGYASALGFILLIFSLILAATLLLSFSKGSKTK